jgi:hypothetical protein
MAAERTACRLLRSFQEGRRRLASLTRGICGSDTMAKLAGKRMLAGARAANVLRQSRLVLWQRYF